MVVDVMIDLTTDVVAVEDTQTAMTEAVTVMVDAIVMARHRQHNMVIQHLVQRLGNLMVGASLMRETSPVVNIEC